APAAMCVPTSDAQFGEDVADVRLPAVSEIAATVWPRVPALIVSRYVTVHGYEALFATFSVSLKTPSWFASLSRLTLGLIGAAEAVETPPVSASPAERRSTGTSALSMRPRTPVRRFRCAPQSLI